MADQQRPAKTFRDLQVWHKAHKFVLAIYSFTKALPKEETFGLSSQMRRAAVSIAANIAEGFAKRGKPDKGRFMNLAEGSLEESRYYLILAQDLGYGRTEMLMFSLEEVSRLLGSYTRAIRASGFWLLFFWLLTSGFFFYVSNPRCRTTCQPH